MATATSASNTTEKKIGVDDFIFGEVLGSGAYGDVVLATKKSNGRQFAAKKIEKKHLKQADKTKYALTERMILSKCDHPNIIKLYYSFRDPTCLYYILELAPNGELLSKIKQYRNFAIPVVKFYAAELVHALEYLHDTQGVIHRDLKPENILLSATNHIKLTDFGTAKEVGKSRDARSDSFVGTAEYISPELLDVDQPIAYKSSDLWALGCIIYQMLTGRLPFKGATDLVTFEKIQTGEVVFPTNFPEDAKDLISRLLAKDPEKRLGAATYDELKGHPFFEGINWNTLHEQTPPEFQSNPEPWIWPDEGNTEQSSEPQTQKEYDISFVSKCLEGEEKIIEHGLVRKLVNGSKRMRLMVLTSSARILYFNPDTKELRAKLSLAHKEPTVNTDGDSFEIALTRKTYKFEVVKGSSEKWREAIDSLRKLKRSSTKRKTKSNE